MLHVAQDETLIESESRIDSGSVLPTVELSFSSDEMFGMIQMKQVVT